MANITASAPCTFATRKGIKIGDAESRARKAYTENVDRESSDPRTLVVGSVYDGIIFNFTEGKVSGIFFGASGKNEPVPTRKEKCGRVFTFHHHRGEVIAALNELRACGPLSRFNI